MRTPRHQLPCSPAPRTHHNLPDPLLALLTDPLEFRCGLDLALSPRLLFAYSFFLRTRRLARFALEVRGLGGCALRADAFDVAFCGVACAAPRVDPGAAIGDSGGEVGDGVDAVAVVCEGSRGGVAPAESAVEGSGVDDAAGAVEAIPAIETGGAH